MHMHIDMHVHINIINHIIHIMHMDMHMRTHTCTYAYSLQAAIPPFDRMASFQVHQRTAYGNYAKLAVKEQLEASARGIAAVGAAKLDREITC